MAGRSRSRAKKDGGRSCAWGAQSSSEASSPSLPSSGGSHLSQSGTGEREKGRTLSFLFRIGVSGPVTQVGVHEPLQAVLEEQRVEVHQQAGWISRQFEIGDDLGFVNGFQRFDGLDLDDDQI